jgi:hypothetical protein
MHAGGLFVWGFLVFSLLLGACGGGGETPAERPEPAAPRVGESAPPPEKIRIRAPDNSVLAVFHRVRQEISIRQNGKSRLLIRRQASDGARWIERHQGPAAFVNWDDKGLTVRDANHVPVWRLRLTEDGWKAARQSTGVYPFVLHGAKNRFTLMQNEDLSLGHFLFQPGRRKVKVYDSEGTLILKSDEAPRNSAFGVLLLPGGKTEEVARYVAMVELLLHGDGV